jgi:hypothetical protein
MKNEDGRTLYCKKDRPLVRINRRTFLWTLESSRIVSTLMDASIIEKILDKDSGRQFQLDLMGIINQVFDASFGLYITNFKYFVELLGKLVREIIFYLNELETSIKAQKGNKSQNTEGREKEYKLSSKPKGRESSSVTIKGNRWKNLVETGKDVQNYFYLDKNEIDNSIGIFLLS